MDIIKSLKIDQTHTGRSVCILIHPKHTDRSVSKIIK